MPENIGEVQNEMEQPNLLDALQKAGTEKAEFFLQYQTVTPFLGLFSIVGVIGDIIYWQAYVIQNGDFSFIVELLQDFRKIGVLKHQFYPIKIEKKELILISNIVEYMVYDGEIEGIA